MRVRDAVLDRQLAKADTATYERDLDIRDPISALWIEVYSPNGATSNKANFISDIITKVEIVDGSEVLASANAKELQALYFFKTGQMPGMFPSEWASGNQREAIPILFGRRLYDQLYAFDPTVFRNPQLKISINKAVVTAAGATGFASGDNTYITVVAKIMENMISKPGKYLMPKQIASWTSGTSGDRRIELPADYVYRMMLLRAFVAESDINEVITDMKITCDTDKYVMAQRKVVDMDAEALAQFGIGCLKHDFLCSHQDTIRLIFNKEPMLQPFYETDYPRGIGVDWAWSSAAKLFIYDLATPTADTTDRNYTCMESGHAPHAILPIPMGLLDDETTWFNPKEYGKIEAVLTEAVAATCSIALEQVRPNIKVG